MKSTVTAALMCAALVVLSGCSRGASSNTSVPEFVYPAESFNTTSSNEVSQAEEPPAETASETILSSNDPLHFTELSFDGFQITARGRYDGERLLEITCGASAKPRYDGEEYTAELYKKSKSGFETLLLTFEGHTERYRIAADKSGYHPADVSEISEKNSAVSGAVVPLPAQGVAEYIDADKDAQAIAAALDEVREISDAVCEGLEKDYDKLRALSAWVSRNIYYDYDAAHTEFTVETLCLSHVLETHRTVCGGFSTLFSALCQAQGIECYNIIGVASNNGHCYAEENAITARHEWNYAIIDGRGIWVDTVWNTDNYYLKDVFTDGAQCFKYFDPTNEVLALDHHALMCEYRDFFSAE